jgi:hypothetical protein
VNQNYSNIFDKSLGERDYVELQRTRLRKKQLSSDLTWQNYDSVLYEKDLGKDIRKFQTEVSHLGYVNLGQHRKARMLATNCT